MVDHKNFAVVITGVYRHKEATKVVRYFARQTTAKKYFDSHVVKVPKDAACIVVSLYRCKANGELGRKLEDKVCAQ